MHFIIFFQYDKKNQNMIKKKPMVVGEDVVGVVQVVGGGVGAISLDVNE